jgi:hypothetical protein
VGILLNNLPMLTNLVPMVQEVIGNIGFSGLGSLQNLNLPGLGSVWNVIVEGLGQLTSLNVNDLWTAAEVLLDGLPNLNTLLAQGLSVLTGDLTLSDIPILEDLNLPALGSISGSLILDALDGLQNLGASALGWVTDAIDIDGLGSLTEFVLDALTSAGDLKITGSGLLDRIMLPGLQWVTNSIKNIDLGSLTTIVLDSLEAIVNGDWDLVNVVSLVEIATPVLETVGVEVNFDQVAGVPATLTWTANQLTDLTSLIIQNSGLQGVVTNLLCDIPGDLLVIDNNALETIGVDCLGKVDGETELTNNPNLEPTNEETSPFWNSLTGPGGWLTGSNWISTVSNFLTSDWVGGLVQLVVDVWNWIFGR